MSLTVDTSATCQSSRRHSQRISGETTASNMISMASTIYTRKESHTGFFFECSIKKSLNREVPPELSEVPPHSLSRGFLTLALPMMKKSKMWKRPKPMDSTASSTVNVGPAAASTKCPQISCDNEGNAASQWSNQRMLCISPGLLFLALGSSFSSTSCRWMALTSSVFMLSPILEHKSAAFQLALCAAPMLLINKSETHC